MPRKAAVLVRVSSRQQANEKKHSIPVQIATCKEYAARHDLEVLEVYADALSGAQERRDNFFRLLGEAEKYEAVVIYHTDRIGRSEELSHKFLRLLHESGLEVHSAQRGGMVEQGLATSAEIMIAAEERRNIIRRTKAARMAMAERGKLPTGMRNYGLRNAGGQAIIHPAEAATVRRVYEWAASGMTHHAIALRLDTLGVKTYSALQDPEHEHRWTKQTISGMIRNEVYKGTYRWGRFAIPVPAIVSEELWQRAQPPRRGPRPVLAFPLTGHIRCGVCGRRMSGRTRKRKSSRTEYYRCNGHGLPNGCTAPELRRDYIEPLAERLIQDTLGDPELLAELLGANTKIPEGVSEQLAEIEAEDARWLEAFRLGAITPAELSNYRSELAAKRRALESVEPQAPTHLEAYARVLKDAPLTEALEASDLVVIASHDSCRLTLEPR